VQIVNVITKSVNRGLCVQLKPCLQFKRGGSKIRGGGLSSEAGDLKSEGGAEIPRDPPQFNHCAKQKVVKFSTTRTEPASILSPSLVMGA